MGVSKTWKGPVEPGDQGSAGGGLCSPYTDGRAWELETEFWGLLAPGLHGKLSWL